MLNRMRKFTEEREQGFTLIELLVVIIIIGILAAIAIPVFLNQRKKGVDASIKSDLKSMATLQETFITDNPSLQGVALTVNEGASGTVSSTNDFKASPGNFVQVALLAGNAGYCIRGGNAGSSKGRTGVANTYAAGELFYYNSSTGGLTTAAC